VNDFAKIEAQNGGAEGLALSRYPARSLGALSPCFGFNCPAMDGRMIDRNAALDHHHLKIAQAQIVGKVPAYRKAG
jgi:hypothetical protein